MANRIESPGEVAAMKEDLAAMLRDVGFNDAQALAEAAKLEVSSAEDFVRFAFWPWPTDDEPNGWGYGFSVGHQYFECGIAESETQAAWFLSMLRVALLIAGARCNMEPQRLASKWRFGGDSDGPA